jgi:citrate lyase subunit alpha/citrate CoA-transferase
VDLDFNVNVNTHSDGWLLHGIGGHQDVAYGSQMNIVTVPLLRKGNPIIKERVLTVTTPGKLIDLIVCEKGIAFNTINARSSHAERNEDLENKCKKAGLPVMSVEDIRNKALKSGGVDIVPEFGEGVVALVKYIDGTVLDHVMSLI